MKKKLSFRLFPITLSIAVACTSLNMPISVFAEEYNELSVLEDNEELEHVGLSVNDNTAASNESVVEDVEPIEEVATGAAISIDSGPGIETNVSVDSIGQSGEESVPDLASESNLYVTSSSSVSAGNVTSVEEEEVINQAEDTASDSIEGFIDTLNVFNVKTENVRGSISSNDIGTGNSILDSGIREEDIVDIEKKVYLNVGDVIVGCVDAPEGGTWSLAKSKKPAASIYGEDNYVAITGLKYGNIKATYTYYDTNSKGKTVKKKYTFTMYVDAPVLSKTELSLTGKGATTTLKVKNRKAPVYWSSDDANVATVSTSGKVKAVGAGETNIIASVNDHDYICTVTVHAPKLSHKDVTLGVGETYRVGISGLADYYTPVWKVKSGKTVVKLLDSSKGEIKALRTGKAVIYTTYNKKKYQVNINVVQDKMNHDTHDYKVDEEKSNEWEIYYKCTGCSSSYVEHRGVHEHEYESKRTEGT